MCIALEKLENENKRLKEQIAYLKRMMFGQKKETFVSDDTPLLPNFEMPEPDAIEEEETEDVIIKRKKKKRKPFSHFEFPENAPREETIFDLSEEEKADLIYIGSDEVEKLGYRPGSYFVKVLITKKYADPKHPEKGVITCDKLLPAIPGSRVDESMLSSLLISKYCDHLPLYRLERIYSRDGLNIGRQTLSSWAHKAGSLLQSLVDLHFEIIMSHKAVFTDDTTIPIQVKGLSKTKTGRIWVYVSGGGPDPPLVYYHFTNDRKKEHTLNKFKDFQGGFHSDAYSAYEELATRDGIDWFPCWSHARRKFFDCITSDPIRMNVLEKIKDLFEKEQEAWAIDKIKGYADSINRKKDYLLEMKIVNLLLRIFSLKFVMH